MQTLNRHGFKCVFISLIGRIELLKLFDGDIKTFI